MSSLPILKFEIQPDIIATLYRNHWGSRKDKFQFLGVEAPAGKAQNAGRKS
jgi:hypothetical protein